MSETPGVETQVRIEVLPIIDPIQLKKDVSFSLTDLDTAMMQQASLFLHYGILLAQASRQVDRFKLKVEIAESFTSRKIRDQMVAAGEKTTEPQIAALVAKDPSVRKYKIAVNEAKQIESVCKTAVEAFRQRKDMLIQQGLLSREEMKGELSIARRNVVADQQNEAKADLLGRLNQISQANA